jgi:hypothetical protein
MITSHTFIYWFCIWDNFFISQRLFLKQLNFCFWRTLKFSLWIHDMWLFNEQCITICSLMLIIFLHLLVRHLGIWLRKWLFRHCWLLSRQILVLRRSIIWLFRLYWLFLLLFEPTNVFRIILVCSFFICLVFLCNWNLIILSIFRLSYNV